MTIFDTIRFGLATLLLASVAGCGISFSGCIFGSGDPATRGHLNQPCTSAGVCHEGVCRDGICQACGNDGDWCCWGNVCNDGIVCTDYGRGPACDAACGHADQAPCYWYGMPFCAAGAAFDGSTLCRASEPAACVGPVQAPIYLINASGCVVATYRAAGLDAEGAVACAEAVRMAYGAGFEVTFEAPQFFAVCRTPWVGSTEIVEVLALNEDDALSCAHISCPGCMDELPEDGMCPMEEEEPPPEGEPPMPAP